MNPNYQLLTYGQVALSAGFVVAIGILSLVLRLKIGKSLAIGAMRTALQLALAGLLLKYLFEFQSVWLVLGLSAVMVVIAAREALVRQKVKIHSGGWSTLTSMALSSLVVSVIVTGCVIGSEPWWRAQVFIPLLGMILGNSLTGISLALNHFHTSANQQKGQIEELLALGATPDEATKEITRDAIRTGMIPMINAMAIVGIVSLPGMMTGQILAGADPKDAVMYQIVVMYMITGATGIGVVIGVFLTRKQLFNKAMAFREG